MSSLSQNDFGSILRELRVKRGLSQKQVAKAAVLDQSYLSALEHGRRPPPRDDILVRLALAMNASPTEKENLQKGRAMTRIGMAAAGLSTTQSEALAVLIRNVQVLSDEELKAVQALLRVMYDIKRQTEAAM